MRTFDFGWPCGVTINLKDDRRGCRDQLTLPGKEFVRRFLQHVLPKRFVRVRYYGFLSHTQRTAALQRCQELLGAKPEVSGPPSEPVAGEPSETPERSIACPHCGRPMQWLGELPRPGGHYRYAVIKLSLLSESVRRQLAAALPPPDS